MIRLIKLTALLVIPVLLAAQANVASHEELTLHAGTQEVLLDFVARNKHQWAIKDLRADEVLVYEDGILQHPNRFRYRGGPDSATEAGSAAASSTSGHAYDPLRTFQPFDPGSAEEQGPKNALGKAAGMLLEIEQRALKNMYEQSGATNIDSLRYLILAQQLLPGRKTVFYISEGLVVPPEQPELLNAVIGEANRSNITFYTLDARAAGFFRHAGVHSRHCSSQYRFRYH